MATKSLIKTINLKTKRDTSNFFYALDKAIKKPDPKVKLDREVQTLKAEDLEKYFNDKIENILFNW